MNSIGLYIHIPFCKSKCPYCDFYSTPTKKISYSEYVNVLTEKIKYWGNKNQKVVSTVYFGGGTPSVLGAELLSDLLCCVKSNFKVENDAEITLEVNPDSGKSLDFSKLYKSGFSRLSIGLQSAVPTELKKLGRIHTAQEAADTIEKAKKAGFENISLDLMMGIPLQNKDSLKSSIDFCKNCGVTHISSYILKVEENTRFYQIQDNLNLPDDDTVAELYLYAVDLLDKYGYKQYEISNFSKEDFESRHNINYWECGEYIGIGPSAHSFYNGKRFYYERDINKFAENDVVFECLGGDEEEFIMLALRLKSGLDNDKFFKRFKKDIPAELFKKAQKYADCGFMEINDGKLSFTPKGFLVSNSIISELI